VFVRRFSLIGILLPPGKPRLRGADANPRFAPRRDRASISEIPCGGGIEARLLIGSDPRPCLAGEAAYSRRVEKGAQPASRAGGGAFGGSVPVKPPAKKAAVKRGFGEEVPPGSLWARGGPLGGASLVFRDATCRAGGDRDFLSKHRCGRMAVPMPLPPIRSDSSGHVAPRYVSAVSGGIGAGELLANQSVVGRTAVVGVWRPDHPTETVFFHRSKGCKARWFRSQSVAPRCGGGVSDFLLFFLIRFVEPAQTLAPRNQDGRPLRMGRAIGKERRHGD